MEVGKHEIISQTCIRYREVMIASRLNLKQQVELTSAKATVVRTNLAMLMSLETQNSATRNTTSPQLATNSW